MPDLLKMFDISGMLPWAKSDGSFWLPPPSSTTSPVVDNLFYLIFGVCAFFFTLIVALMVLFVILYRRRPGVEPAKGPTHNLALELTWSLIPLAIVIFIFYQGFVGYMDIRTSPREAYEVRVTGRKWTWSFAYPNGHVDPDLHVPADQPVRLIMTSEDVIHSLSIPDFRLKMDVVPGRYTRAWFQAPQPGRHDLYCAEYCGTDHSTMMATVIVHERGEFERWLADAAKVFEQMSPAEKGAMLYRRMGCAGCHSTDGSATSGGGPSLLAAYGRTHQFADGSTAVVEDNYIRESIMDPSAKVRAGYRDQMPTYKGRLSDEEITAIIEFIKSLK